MSAFQTGLSCKLYHDVAASWTLIEDAQDVTLSQTHQEATVNRRGSEDEETLVGQKVREISFDLTYDKTGVAYEALRDAYENATVIFMAVYDGAIATSGSEGLQVYCYVTEFTRNEPVNGAVTLSVTLKPAANATAAPVYAETA
jgi:hypothetical protein